MKVDRFGALAVMKVWGVTTPPPIPFIAPKTVIPNPCSDINRYTLQDIKGWKICFSIKMPSSTFSRMVTQLTSDFTYIQGVLLPDAYDFLMRNVRIFVE